MHHNHRYGQVVGSEYCGQSLEEIVRADDLPEEVPLVKLVSWEVVRNIANSLTNQLLYLGTGIEVSQAHLSSWFDGPRREFTLEDERDGCWRHAISGNGDGWYAFDQEDVLRLFWESGNSQCGLEAQKIGVDCWELKFIPSPCNPSYRGRYWETFVRCEELENVLTSD